MAFFDFNNLQHQQLADAYSSGNASNLDPQQVASAYQGFVDHGPEDEVQEVHQEYFNKMPKVEQMGLFSSLIDAAKQNGIDPKEAGVSTTDPRKASSFDLGNLFNLARSSGLLGGMLGGGQSQSQSGGLGALGGLLGGNNQSQSGLGALGGLLGGNNQSQSGGLGALGGMLGGGNQSQSGGLGALGGMLGGNQQANNEPNNQSQNSGGFGGLGNIISNPIAQAAIGGLISYAASRALGGNKQEAAAQPSQNQLGENQPGPSSLGQPQQSGFSNTELPPTNQSDNGSM